MNYEEAQRRREVPSKNAIQRLFDRISPRYDFLNRVNSLGLDLGWRRDLARHVLAERPEVILDVAAGTGDLSLMLAKGAKQVVSADISIGMMEHAVQKARRKGIDNIKITVGDALDLPFEHDQFDAVTCAFGVRNFESIIDFYREAYRVLKPNGMIAILEMCRPEHPLLRQGYEIHANVTIPLVSQMLGGNRGAYRYLAKSIEKVPHREEMKWLLEEAGFKQVYYKIYAPEVCGLYVGYKPSDLDHALEPAMQQLDEIKEG
ncbi:MAG: ubiquinone/menaquinone biosynthesis methyltransferase [Porphyromonas sp.]|nr:ubiquinone/menaquinone biosynthesis methyltransferase [Porphyromonas sp.]